MISLKEFFLLFFVTFSLVDSWLWQKTLHLGEESDTFGTIKKYTRGMKSLLVPYFVRNCITEVERRGLEEIGLYRVCGSKNNIEKIIKSYRKKKNADLSKFDDINDITGALKLFLRSMKGRIIDVDLGKELLLAIENLSPNLETELKEIISKLPTPNIQTLAFIILHLQVVPRIPENEMNIPNLAIVVAPSVFSDIGIAPKDSIAIVKSRIKIFEKLLEIPSDFWYELLRLNDASEAMEEEVSDTDSIIFETYNEDEYEESKKKPSDEASLSSGISSDISDDVSINL
ncbi:rac GTPase-activating protein 1-like isoform X1 [Leptopilina boulardi]|uniref:rac GTPase-activating protein 1-like isoform X1 n=2 Tax=Leptopilina boulardi TaxID=63433 RepID=UPI0021F6323C|nr:rac GTPase-activating protein 1-like isoform X1 [Leptopilina boulardi]XP_051153348.1 rac GTPase-activating protein 1-like isoform X1 [Leptopilina boulardi]